MVMQVAGVTLWNELVGALAFDTEQQLATFEYAPEWIAKGIELSPLMLPTGQSKFQFPSSSNTPAVLSLAGLPGMIADGLTGLPSPVDGQLTDSTTPSPLARLVYSGALRSGALSYHFSGVSAHQHGQNLFSPAEPSSPCSIEDLVASVCPQQQPMESLWVMPADEEQLFQLADPQIQHPENALRLIIGPDNDQEQRHAVTYATVQMAKACDIAIAPTRLISTANGQHLLVGRCDLVGGVNNDDSLVTADSDSHSIGHYHSFWGLSHACNPNAKEYSYEHLFAVMRQLRLDRQAALNVIRRMLFHVMTQSRSDHSKAFGFVMDRHGQWQLAPACGISLSGVSDTTAPPLMINGKRHPLSLDDLLAVVPSLRSEAQAIAKEMAERIAAWPLFARQAGVERQRMLDIQRRHDLFL